MIQLRNYQRRALDALNHDHARLRRILLVLPTGAGKTRTAVAYLSSFVERGRRVLWIAHSKELLDQAHKVLVDTFGPDLVCRRYAGRDDSRTRGDALVWVVNNLTKRGSGPRDVDLIVIDEAHRAFGKSYREWLSHYRAYARNGARVLGLTATPYRLDGGVVRPLTAFRFSRPSVPVFERTSFARAFNDLVAEGWLRPFVHHRLETGMRFDVTLKNGDISNESLGVLNSPERNALLANYWRRHREQFGSTLVFAGSVCHARDLADAFGPEADYVAGVAPDDEPDHDRRHREQTIARFRDGKLRVLVNVGIFREGVDVPRIGAVMLARPTMSPGLFTQMVGRGARPHPGKDRFHLVDVHDQLGQYEGEFCGVELLESTLTPIEAVPSVATESGALEQGPLRTAAADRRVLIHAAIAVHEGVQEEFGGWITFRRGDGEAVAVGMFLTHADLRFLAHLAPDGQVHASMTHAARLESERVGSRCLYKCARALGQHLIGTLHTLDSSHTASLLDLRRLANQVVRIPSSELEAFRAMVDAVEDRAWAWGVSEPELTRALEALAYAPVDSAALLRIAGDSGGSTLRLADPATWTLIHPYLKSAMAGTLTDDNAARLLAALATVAPDLAAHLPDLLAAVGRARAIEEVALELTTPGGTACSRCRALAGPSHRFCGFCGTRIPDAA